MHSQFISFCKNTNLILVIDHAGRSGNNFFLSIFDRHPQILSCPWLHYTYSYFLHIFGEQEKILSTEAVAHWTEQRYFALVYQELNENREALIRKMGSDPQANIDRHLVRDVFDQIIGSEKTISRQKLILATYFAFALGTGRDPAKIRYILLSDSISLRNENFFSGYSGKILDAANKDFPEARLIHLVRDPRAGFASSNHQFINQLGNMYGLHWGNACSRIQKIARLEFDWEQIFIFGFWLMYFRQTYEAIMRKKEEYPQLFLTIKNEDLNLDFCRSMRKLSESLNVDYLQDWDANESFQPTHLGKIWRGTGAYNSNYCPGTRLENESEEKSRACAGPNRHVTERWKKRLKKHEIRLIEKFLQPEFASFDYPLLATSGKTKWHWLLDLFRPLEGELPSLTWLKKGKQAGNCVFWDRLFFCAVCPFYFFLVRIAFLCVVYKTNVFRGDSFVLAPKTKNTARKQ